MAEPGESKASSGWTTSLGLMAGIRANEAAAWERFTCLYGSLFDYWFRLANLPEGDWADLRQETFLAVSRSLSEYTHVAGRGAFRGWLRVIVRNKLTDHWRKRVPIPDPLAVADRPAPDPLASESPTEHRLLLRRALELIRTDFAPHTWQAFWLVTIEDRSPTDAATELGVPVNVVYLARARVLRRLREEFADFLNDLPPPAPSPAD